MDVASTESELRALMLAALDGDATAYRDLLARIGGHLRGYFRERLSRANRGPTEAEDLVQETLMAIHTRRHTYDTSQPFTPWLYAIARYKLVDYFRRTKTSFGDEPIENAEEITSHDDRKQVESNLDLEKLLARLSPKAQEAIRYVKLEGLSVAEAAARCGVSEPNLKVIVHRGMKALAVQVSRGSGPRED